MVQGMSGELNIVQWREVSRGASFRIGERHVADEHLRWTLQSRVKLKCRVSLQQIVLRGRFCITSR